VGVNGCRRATDPAGAGGVDPAGLVEHKTERIPA
jgi:hypothetical protein